MSTTDTQRRITTDECGEMRRRAADGELRRSIATAFGCARSTARYHIDGKCSHDIGPDKGCIVDRPHLTQSASPGTRLTADRPQEAYCRDCHARITIGPDGTEYGHRRRRYDGSGRCPNRPSQCDSNAPSKFKSEGE